MTHKTTFEYLKPTAYQLDAMEYVRSRFKEFTESIEEVLPDGPDKTYIIRKLRECAMWSNVCITREADGAPRT